MSRFNMGKKTMFDLENIAIPNYSEANCEKESGGVLAIIDDKKDISECNFFCLYRFSDNNNDTNNDNEKLIDKIKDYVNKESKNVFCIDPQENANMVFYLLRDEYDIINLSDALTNDTPAMIFLTAIISYIIQYCDLDVRNFESIMKLSRCEDKLGYIFSDCKEADPDSFAVKQYRSFMMFDDSTRKSAIATILGKLCCFDIDGFGGNDRKMLAKKAEEIRNIITDTNINDVKIILIRSSKDFPEIEMYDNHYRLALFINRYCKRYCYDNIRILDNGIR